VTAESTVWPVSAALTVPVSDRIGSFFSARQNTSISEREKVTSTRVSTQSVGVEQRASGEDEMLANGDGLAEVLPVPVQGLDGG